MLNLMKPTVSSLTILLIVNIASGQGKFLTNNGMIHFFSSAPLEDIEAVHEEVSAVIDATTGDVAIIVKMTGFTFEKKLMQEHFNENYVESHKYPKAIFNGSIKDLASVSFAEEGVSEVRVEGTLELHGVSRPIEVTGTIESTPEGLIARTKFMMRPEDYEIKIPRVVRNNIAREVEVTVELPMAPI